MDEIFRYIDEHKNEFINNLKEAVAIKSVSGWPNCRNECVKIIEWAAKYLEKEGAAVTLEDIGSQTMHDGTTLPLPPVLLGTLGNDPKKKTVCIYGHLDVMPAAVSDGWNTDPFVLTEKDGKLYGRGATDDKGPVLGWLHAISAYNATKTEIPVNLKFCLEGMEESGSEGLDDLIVAKKDTFFKDVDYVCISDNYWLGKSKPCITYGLRHEALPDLIALMNSLIDVRGNILVPGVMDDVLPVTPGEESLYDPIDFNCDDLKCDAGCKKVIREDKKKTLMRRWRFPSLSLHGIQGAFDAPGTKTVIPGKVTGKFSIRTVPNQDPVKIEKLVVEYLKKVHESRGTPNKLNVFMDHGSKAWVSDPNHPHYMAGRKAMKKVYGVEPDMIREGGSIPVTLTFEETLGKNIMLLSLGCADDGAHSQNEKMDIRNYIEGTKVLADYIYEVSQL